MSQTADAVITRWVDVLMGRSQRLIRPSRSNIVVEAERIYSYGRHFEMARPLRGKRGEITAWLVNGDTFSHTTSQHQRSLRGCLERTGIPLVIIPYRALVAANVDPDSVRIVEVTPEWHEQVPVHTTTFPEGAVWKTEEVATAWETGPVAGGYTWRKPIEHEQRRFLQVSARGWERWEVSEEDGVTHYRRTRHVHHLGESVLTATVPYTTSRRCRACGSFGRRPGYGWGYVRGYGYTEANGQGRDTLVDYRDTTGCETCGGRGVQVTVQRRSAYFLSAFDMQETRPAYFFCELPKGARPRSVEEAREALKPEAVLIAEGLGRTVLRQGDVFMVPTNLTTRQLRKVQARTAKGKEAFVLGVNHRMTEVIVTTDGLTFGRGTMTHDPGEFRDPDHKRVTAPKGVWMLVVKNTVPVAA